MGDSSKKDEVAVEIKKGPPPPRRSVLQRVPALLRGNKKQKHTYDPVAVPLGPYHHGRLPEYQVAEQLKEEILDMVCGGRRDKAGFLLGKISERVAEIREFYGGADGYGDEELAAMMLRDTCFLMCLVNVKYTNVIYERLGLYRSVFMYRDLFMLENQIPLWLLNLLIPFALDYHDDNYGRLNLYKLLLMITDPGSLALMVSMSMTTAQLPWGNGEGEEPLHLLDALYRTFLYLAKTDEDDNGSKSNANHSNPRDQPLEIIRELANSPKGIRELADSPFRSVTDLKAKGVHFSPSSPSLKDISFFSFTTHARLHLPLFRITPNSMSFILNLVAFEMMSAGTKDLGVIPYVNFMKALLRRAEDVTLLREKGVLYSTLANDDEVVRLFQDIDTCGVRSSPYLYKVRMRIEAHCNSRGKTWLAELINTYFRSPLTAVALFAAAFILALTFLQTFYTINPK